MAVVRVHLLICAQTMPGGQLIDTGQNHARKHVNMDICRTYSCTNVLSLFYSGVALCDS